MMGKSKEIYVRWRICNCTDFVLGEGIIRTIIETMNPKWKNVNKVPCDHWEKGKIGLK